MVMKTEEGKFGGILMVLFWVQIGLAAWFGFFLIRDIYRLLLNSFDASERLLISSVLLGTVVLVSLVSAFGMRLRTKFMYTLTKVFFSFNALMIFACTIAALFMPELYQVQNVLWMFGIPLLIEAGVLILFTQIKNAKVYYRIGI